VCLGARGEPEPGPPAAARWPGRRPRAWRRRHPARSAVSGPMGAAACAHQALVPAAGPCRARAGRAPPALRPAAAASAQLGAGAGGRLGAGQRRAAGRRRRGGARGPRQRAQALPEAAEEVGGAPGEAPPLDGKLKIIGAPSALAPGAAGGRAGRCCGWPSCKWESPGVRSGQGACEDPITATEQVPACGVEGLAVIRSLLHSAAQPSQSKTRSRPRHRQMQWCSGGVPVHARGVAWRVTRRMCHVHPACEQKRWPEQRGRRNSH